MSDFFAMGGYAQYVWPAYAIALVVIGGMAIQSVLANRRTKRDLDAAQIHARR